MAVKTITITEDAYEVMKRLKGESESFSELFKRLGKRYATVHDIRGIIKHTPAEAEAFATRVLSIHEGLGEGFERRAHDIHTRFKRTH